MNDMAEHRPISNNNQNAYFLSFRFAPKTGIKLSKMDVWFLLYVNRFETFKTILRHALMNICRVPIIVIQPSSTQIFENLFKLNTTKLSLIAAWGIVISIPTCMLGSNRIILTLFLYAS